MFLAVGKLGRQLTFIKKYVFYLKNVLISFHVQLKGTVCAPVMVEYLCILIVTVDRKDNNAQMNIIYYGYLGSYFLS